MHQALIIGITRKIFSSQAIFTKVETMSVSSLSSMNSSLYMYQWNNQQLQGSVSTSTSSSSNASSVYSSDISSSISSMVELAKYAMDAMGVSSSDRVTFSQIEQYKSELESSFSEELNAAIANTIVSPTAYFSVSLSDTGALTIDTAHDDEALIQAYFSTNPAYAENLRARLDEAGYTGAVDFSVNSAGEIVSVTPQTVTEEQELTDATFGTSIVEGLASQGVNLTQSFSVRFDGTAVVVEGDSTESAAVNQYLQDNPNIASEIKATLESQGQTVNSVVIINSAGVVTSRTTFTPQENTQEASDVQDFLQNNDVGQEMKNRLDSVGIDPNVDFRLTVVDGKVTVNSSHPDAEKVQALIDSSEDLTKKYLQIDALAGLEGARKSMQVDPSAIRSRIQMESLAAWWDQTGTDSIGSFSSGNLSSFTGVNSVA